MVGTGEVRLRVNGLTYTYPDGSTGLRDLSLEVRSGEVVLLLGANGTGKSTLLRCIVGLLPGQGEIEVCVVRLAPKTLRAVRLVAGLVFQSPDDQLFCPTVIEDVAYGPLHQGLGPEDAREIAQDCLRQVGLAGFEERVPHHLSHGERKRVALAAVLALEPTLLLLDEPTAGLDPRSASSLMDILERYRAQGKAILATTHDLHMVGELADRVAILGEDRKLVAEGKPETLLADVDLLTRHNLMHQHRHRHGGLVHAHPHSPLHEHGHAHGLAGTTEHTHDTGHTHDAGHTHDIGPGHGPDVAGKGRAHDLWWVYLFALIPSVTELLETGRFPTSTRELVTDLVLSVLLLGCAHWIRGQTRALEEMAKQEGRSGTRRSAVP